MYNNNITLYTRHGIFRCGAYITVRRRPTTTIEIIVITIYRLVGVRAVSRRRRCCCCRRAGIIIVVYIRLLYVYMYTSYGFIPCDQFDDEYLIAECIIYAVASAPARARQPVLDHSPVAAAAVS